LAPFQFGIYEGKRRVVFFGWRYDFTHQRLEAAEELPAWLVPLAGGVERFAALPSGSIKHALCTEYVVGAGIGWHRDKKHWALPRLGLQIPFPPQSRQQVGTLHAQRAATLALRDDRRLPPCLGAQHPAGRNPTLFDHIPYDGPSLIVESMSSPIGDDDRNTSPSTASSSSAAALRQFAGRTTTVSKYTAEQGCGTEAASAAARPRAGWMMFPP
jgi:hypothetical protein